MGSPPADAGGHFRTSVLCVVASAIESVVARAQTRIDAIWCNDLDTLAPALWDGTLPVVYDSHEYFTEAAGLTGKPVRRWVWLTLERWAMKRIPCMITVNESIAEAYRASYGVEVLVVRNMPRRQPPVQVEGRQAFAEYDVPLDLPIALMQERTWTGTAARLKPWPPCLR